MKRDLLFFVSGLVFGVAAGYFVFRAVAPSSVPAGGAVAESAARPPSTLGLKEEPKVREIDPAEMRALEAQAQENANDAAVRTKIGARYLEAGKYEDARKWLEESVRLDPQDLHARNHLAITYLSLSQVEPAVAAFEENLRRDPAHPASLLGLVRVKLYVQKDIQGGLALWEKLVQVAPDSVEARAVRDELEALKSAHAGS
jgi:tetratricopeptide (TPR) repeat protein